MLHKHAALSALTAFLVLGLGCTREVSFKQDVYPILSANCLSCHKPGAEGFVASGLSMEDYDSLLKGTKNGPVIVPGSHVSSTLIILVEHKAHPSINMPKGRSPLPDSQIEIIRQWIDQGAKNN